MKRKYLYRTTLAVTQPDKPLPISHSSIQARFEDWSGEWRRDFLRDGALLETLLFFPYPYIRGLLKVTLNQWASERTRKISPWSSVMRALKTGEAETSTWFSIETGWSWVWPVADSRLRGSPLCPQALFQKCQETYLCCCPDVNDDTGCWQPLCWKEFWSYGSL